MSGWLQHFSEWYLDALAHGGYWLIAGLMALESTLVPIPSELIIPPAAYLAHTRGEFSWLGVVLAGTVGSFAGASLMYGAARWLGRPLVMKLGPYLALSVRKIEMAERWSAHYGWAGVFVARLLPVIRHLIGIPAGILRLDYPRYALATLCGSLIWCAVLAWLGKTVGEHPELLAGSLHRFVWAVATASTLLAALYYFLVHRPAHRAQNLR